MCAAKIPNAVVLSSNRRRIVVLHLNKKIKLENTSDSELVAGDKLILSENLTDFEHVERKNCLTRSYFGRTKEISANLDKLFIVTAVGELFNTIFIDRVICMATLEGIPICLVVNKMDLLEETDLKRIAVYKNLDIQLFETSAKQIETLSNLQILLADPTLRTCAFTGVSGVGKTSILNQLVPGMLERTAEVSHKTGQGKQTTTMAQGHIYPRGTNDLILIDLPGIQNFGVSDLDLELVKYGFIEFGRLEEACEFDDCLHDKERTCAVKEAIKNGIIAESRYKSYLNIINEIRANTPY